MDRQAVVKIIKETFENPFDKGRFINLTKNLFKSLDISKKFTYQGNIIPDAYEQGIQTLERVGKYEDDEGNKIDVLIVRLKKERSLERARTMQRNFVAWYLNGSRGGELKDAALVAFVSPESRDWRFSLVRMDYNIAQSPSGRVKVEKELTPARRYSFLVGENESSHTAQVQLLPILQDDERKPLLSDFEKAFNIEVVTREFFTKYHELFHDVEEALEGVMRQNAKAREDFEAKNIDPVNFAKKLLGQIVFLYFLQKKGWFGVGRDEDWGTGPKDFLRRLFEKKVVQYGNFFNDVLEPLFYEALAVERTDDFYSHFNCKIPFLNGGLFDPINNYDWVHTDILLPNELFSNNIKTDEEDTGTGILDVFDRYNFTVKEDEPLDKEVAVDPEMLGKVFENLLEVKDRKSKGTYYTPREIVHYMCQESLINYLDTALNTGAVPLVATDPPQGKLFGNPDPQQGTLETPGYRAVVPCEDIEAFVRMGELVIEHDTRVENYGKETERYSYKLPESIRQNAKLIDEKLAQIRVCDPAIGSGAFPVGLMTEIVRARNTLSTYLPDKTGRTSYHFKRHSIQNCLYGVDIDPGAIEIAKLRLWLSLVVDEEDIKQIQPLPNLDYKVVCGNSLLGVERDMFNNELFQKLEELKPLYFDETNARKKQEYRNQIDQLIKKLTNDNEIFDFEVYFSEVFHEKGGFDVVIGNPPYVRVDEIPPNLREKYKALYKTTSGKYDLYYLFFECSLLLSNNYGSCIFISPNKYCASESATTLRETLLKSIHFGEIISTSRLKIFEAAANYPVISILRKGGLGENIFIVRQCNDIKLLNEKNLPKSYITSSKILETFPNYVIPINVTADSFNLVRRLYNTKVLLSEVLNISEGLRIPIKFETENSADYEIVKQYQFERYSKIRKGTNISARNLQNVISKDSARYKKIMTKKILISEDGLRINATIDKGMLIPQGGVYFATPITSGTELEFFLGLLNSKLFSYIYEVLFSGMHMGGGYLRYRSKFLENLPLPKALNDIPGDIKSEISKLVLCILEITDKVTEFNKGALAADTMNYDNQIDQMVYELYGLTPEEIAVVEGKSKENV